MQGIYQVVEAWFYPVFWFIAGIASGFLVWERIMCAPLRQQISQLITELREFETRLVGLKKEIEAAKGERCEGDKGESIC